MLNKKTMSFWAAIGLLTAGLVPQAFAEGTDAGETISNTATVSYQVGGVDQVDVDSNEATFIVDRVIRMTLDRLGSAVPTVPGATAVVSSYTLTNTSNDTLDFDLVASHLNVGDTFDGYEDSIDGTNIAIYIDSNNDGIADAGELASTVENLAADSSVVVLVVMDIPLTAIDEDVSGVALVAEALEENGDPIAITNGEIDTVFADLEKADTADIAYDGKVIEWGGYLIETARISVVKTSAVISDPFSSSDPKFIPGAVVEYCMVITNDGTSVATGAELTDGIPANTSYVASSVTIGTGDTCGTNVTGSGGEVGTPVTSISGNFANIASGTSVWVSFQVTLN